MDTQTPQPGETGSESSRPTDVSFNLSLIDTQQERRYEFVHCDAAIAATKNITQDAHLKIYCKTGRKKNKT